LIIKGINCEVMKQIRLSNIKKKGFCVLAATAIISSTYSVMADEITTETTESATVVETTVATDSTEEVVCENTADVATEEVTQAGSTVNTVTRIKKLKKNIKVNSKLKLKKLKAFKSKDMSDFTYQIKNKKVAKVSKSGVIKGLKSGKAVVTVKMDGATYARVTVKVKDRYKDEQLRLLSSLIFCEANTESYAGKKAVGIVTMNRVESALFPNTLNGVVYQRGQYTPARSGALSRALNMYDNGSIPSDCIKAAKETLNGVKSVTLGTKEVNMTGYLFFSRYVPNRRLQIGAHQFK